MAYSTSYTASLSNGIKDLAENPLATTSWSFTTAAQTQPDTTPPTVTSKSPTSGATGVAVGSSITATFSEAVQSATVTGTTFTLKNSAGTSIAGTVTYDSATKTATFTPSAPPGLAYSTSYTASLSNGIKDIAGNGLTPNPTRWSFTTARDTISPTVSTKAPLAGATGVAVSSSVTATFSEAVQSSTVTGTTFTLKNSAGTGIAGTVTYNAASFTATFKPSAALAYSTSYTASLSNGIKDIAGNGLTPNPTRWSFTTARDTISPTVSTKAPLAGATGVAVSSSVTATFSEAVQSSTVTGTTFTLKNSTGTSIPGTVTYDAASFTATFKPSAALAYSTSYTATLTNGIKDIAGNSLSGTSWLFTTVAAPLSSCDNNLAVGSPTSSGSQGTYGPSNAFDNNINTRWWSTFIVNPWIRGDLGSQKSICSLDIAWADGSSRQYSFLISVSNDGTTFNTVYTGKSSGITSSPQKYSFPETSARFIQVTITQSHVSSTMSIARISELDVFGQASTAGLSVSSQTQNRNSKLASSSGENEAVQAPPLNHPPVARDDMINGKVNTPLLLTVLGNDLDPDGEKLKVTSVSQHSKKGGTVTLNGNGTITLLPAAGFVGVDSFTYTIADENGKTDKAKVSVFIKANTIRQGHNAGSTNQKSESVIGPQGGQTHQQEEDDRLQLKRQIDKNKVLDELTMQPAQNAALTNDTKR